MARRTVAERIHQAAAEGYEQGRLVERARLEADGKNLTNDQARARNEMMRAAADLALANAKLTYALSRIINEKGW